MKSKGIVLVVILLLASIMMPFDVYADTISNSNVHINYYLDSVTETASGTYMQTYKVEFVFDQSYLGWISSRMVGTYIDNNTLPITTSQFTKTQAIYVNGTTAATSFTFVTPNTQNGGALQSLSQNIENSNVTPLADLSTLDDILNVLNDINNNIEIDVIQELQNIVANTSLSNDYLQLLTKLRQWNIPIESIPVVSMVLTTSNDLYYDLYNYHYMNFPVFHYPNIQHNLLQNVVLVPNASKDFIFIMSNFNSVTQVNTEFYLNNSNVTASAQILNANFQLVNSYASLIKIKFTNTTSNLITFQFLKRGTGDRYLMPIYLGDSDSKYIGTDFALQFGLSNDLIDNIKTIANGTNQSNQAASDLESNNDQMSDDMDDLATIENGYNQQFNNQLQQIDFSSPLQNNAGILPAANFVISIFNGLINNNPFSVLIIVVCILLIGKKVIGK